MISIIICSKNPIFLKEVSENVKETIGVLFEIIAMENHDGKYGICQAYNLGAAKAKYDIFCFMHEDISFVTQNWGLKVLKHLEDKKNGLIGVVGAHPTTFLPCSYHPPLLMHEANIIVQSNGKDKPSHHSLRTIDPSDKSVLKSVTGIDGVWMCTRRDVFVNHKFDEKTLTGFHGYDADFSLEILHGGFKVCVVFDILMYHYSSGYTNQSYMEQHLKLSKKWGKKSIFFLKDKPIQELATYHWIAMNKLIEKLFLLEYNPGTIIKHFFSFSMNSFFRIKPFLSLLIYMIRRITFKSFSA
ncbi:MAG: hypothetical protein H7Y07_06350 [Pyrinomonadaceae bacterium]|nr:hypothetical protein [Sphingobacteriaceae bacterium]